MRLNSEQLIGSRQARAAAIILWLVCVSAIALDRAGVMAREHGVLRSAGWAAGFLALLAVVHWSHRIYSRWMRLAGVLNAVVTAVLLGVAYFAIVPLFWAIVQTRRAGRRMRGRDSYWHARRRVDPDLRYFQRMG
jgi:hypothetical protein